MKSSGSAMATRLFSCGPLRVQLMAVNCLLAHHMYLTVQSNRTIVAFLGCDSRQKIYITESLRVIREYRILSQDARRTKSFRGNCFVGPIGTKSYCLIQYYRNFPSDPIPQNLSVESIVTESFSREGRALDADVRQR
jgi:hypothetical protein